METVDKLFAHLSSFPTAPFLFVGSGISRRYLDLDDWKGLLRRLASLTEKPFDYYSASASGDNPGIATLIAKEFHEIWWESDVYAEARKKWAADCIGPESALKIQVAEQMLLALDGLTADSHLQEELEALRRITVDGIITTNWDQLLEDVFPEFRIFAGQDRLLFNVPQGIAEIYKIHGCCSQPNSLVITNDDYEQFRARNPYLAAKLLSAFVEHPVVFLGYSLTDPNIAEILASILRCLTPENIDKLRDRLIFIQRTKDNEDSEMTTGSIIVDETHLPVQIVKIADFLPLYSALAKIKRRFPARLLRQLKEHVYELVQSNDPAERLYVQDLDADVDLSEVDVVLGVGMISTITEKGYEAVTRLDLLKDVIYETNRFDAEQVLLHSLPSMLRGAKYVPIFKYLLADSRIDDAGNCDVPDLDERVQTASSVNFSHFAPPKQYTKKRAKIRSYKAGVADLNAKLGPRAVIEYGTLLPQAKIDLTELHDYLISNTDYLDTDNSFLRTQYIKLVCAYDYLKHRSSPTAG